MNEQSSKATVVSMPVLVLSVLLAVAGTAAVVLALRPSQPPTMAATTSADPGLSARFIPPSQPPATNGESARTRSLEPFVQKDVVSPDNQMTGKVYYPLPYSSPPHLKLTAKERKYDIVEQDEFGFSWAARPKLEDFDPKHLEALKTENTDPLSLLGKTFNAIASSGLKPNLTFEDFTWEAKGVQGKSLPRTYEQTGTFNSLANAEGEVIYPIPYAQPAHVSLGGGNYGAPYTTVIQSRADGFKWKNIPDPQWINYATGSVTWTAKGLRVKADE